MGRMQIGGPAFVVHADGSHQVQAQKSQVDQIVAAQRLIAKVRVHQAQPSKSSVTSAQATDLRQQDLRRISDEDVLDSALTGNEHSDLAPDRVRNLAEKTAQLRRDDIVRAGPPPIDTFERG